MVTLLLTKWAFRFKGDIMSCFVGNKIQRADFNILNDKNIQIKVEKKNKIKKHHP